MYQLGERQRDSSFQSDDTKGDLVRWALFFMSGMRGMVGRYDIDGSVFQGFEQGFVVILAAEGAVS